MQNSGARVVGRAVSAAISVWGRQSQDHIWSGFRMVALTGAATVRLSMVVRVDMPVVIWRCPGLIGRGLRRGGT